MEIISFRAESSNGRRRAHVGMAIDDTWLLDCEGAYRGEPPENHVEWLDMDGPWFRQSLETHGRLAGDASLRERAEAQGWIVERAHLTVDAPVPRPGKLICIGLNYRDHAAEIGLAIPSQPVVFSKFTTAVIAPGAAVVVPLGSQKVDYEAELAVVIGRRAKGVSASRALEHVLGYTVLNDVTARDFQTLDGQWQRSKSCDTFAPMGPAIMTTDVVRDPHALPIRLTLNGATMQDSNTDQLIFGVPELIEFLSRTVTLEPGDVIATGTPPGVGAGRTPPVFLAPGDVMTVEIGGIGALTNPVAG
jgi:2-keto-4-pentenoate hydratase/2-oxohepta-3-ene-1,7-dioic acid hydratase in catechol pathway